MRTRRRLCVVGLVLCAVMLPKAVHAHSSDVLLSRLVLGNSPEVALEVTADLSGVAWLREVSNPAEALGRALRIELPGGHSWALAELGKPEVVLHTGFPYPAPVAVSHPGEEPAPELMTVRWRWRPSASPLQLVVAQGSPATLLFWTVQSGVEVPDPGWRLILEGERSQAVSLPFKPAPLQWNWKARVAGGVAAGGLCLQAVLIFGRLRRLRSAYLKGA